MLAFDRQRFFSAFSASIGVALNPGRQQGLTFLLERFERDAAFTNHRELAYVLATIHWETGRTFAPVKEVRADPGRNPKLYTLQERYWPSGYYGRGYVQLTWDYNYRNASQKLKGEVFPVGAGSVTITPTTFLEHPEFLLEPEISYRIAARGMREGWFTGAKLSRFISASAPPDYVNARKIINGLDQAETIAALARRYEALLTDAEVTVAPVEVAPAATGGGAASLGAARRAPLAAKRPATKRAAKKRTTKPKRATTPKRPAKPKRAATAKRAATKPNRASAKPKSRTSRTTPKK